MVRCRVRVCGSGLGFWNLVGSGKNKRFSGRIIGTPMGATAGIIAREYVCGQLSYLLSG